MRDNVWFTYKARINAHHRLEWLEKHSQFILVWYAILGAVLAIVTIRFPKTLGENTDIWATILSVALLGISLAVSNLDFRGRAIAMRKNYLSLQRLCSEIPEGEALTVQQRQQYHELLNEVENHLDIDDKSARVAQSGLTTRMPTNKERYQVILWKIKRLIFTYSFYLVPFFLVWANYDC